MLHRNMLYSLSFQVQSEHEQHDDVDHESLVEDQSESVDDSLDDQPIQQGPMTRSCTKALMKANLLMSEHFGIDKFLSWEDCITRNLDINGFPVSGKQLVIICKSFKLNFESISIA